MSEGLAVFGAITGGLALAISFLVYLRDSPRVVVRLLCDMEGFGDRLPLPHLVLLVTNVGRRPIYLSRMHIPSPVSGGDMIIFKETTESVTLNEGAPPQVAAIYQSGLEDTWAATHWWRMRARVWDASGRAYRSRWLTEKPSFATAEAPPGALVVAAFLNWLSDFRLRLLA